MPNSYSCAEYFQDVYLQPFDPFRPTPAAAAVAARDSDALIRQLEERDAEIERLLLERSTEGERLRAERDAERQARAAAVAENAMLRAELNALRARAAPL
jgi:hypothetical protein